MKYEIGKINDQDWLNKDPWYNKAICSRFHEIMFEEFITHGITDRYTCLCYLVSHDKKKPAYEDEESILVDRLVH